MTLGDKIALARKERNLTQEAFADMLEVSRQAVSRWESDLAYPDMDKIVKVCSTLELDCDYLLKKEADGSEIAEVYEITPQKSEPHCLTTGAKISLARKRMNLTQEQLAGLTGVSRQSVSRWESDAAYPEMDKIVKLCNTLEINCDYLLKSGVTESGIKVVEKVVEKEVVVERLIEKTVYNNVSESVVYEYINCPEALPDIVRQKAVAPRKPLSLSSMSSLITGACSILLGSAFFLFGVVTLCIAMYWSYGSLFPLMLLWLSVGIGVALISCGVNFIRAGKGKDYSKADTQTIMR